MPVDLFWIFLSSMASDETCSLELSLGSAGLGVVFDSGHGKNRIIHRDTLKRQGVQNATTLNYVCTAPNFQHTWKLLMGDLRDRSLAPVDALEGMRSLSLESQQLGLEDMELPCSLEHLTLPRVRNFNLPRNLQTLTFGDRFNEVGVDLPDTLQKLTFGEDFNQSLRYWSLPQNLVILTFGCNFNQSLKHVKLPQKLQVLTFGNQFNQSLDGVCFPHGLLTLTFGDSFDQKLEGVDFSDALEHLTLGRDFDQAIEAVRWPNQLKELTFGENWNGCFNASHLPDGLQSLTFGNRFWNLKGQLPKGLRSLILGENFPNFTGKQIPQQLQKLSLGSELVQSLKAEHHISWPTTLSTVTFGDEVNHQLRGNTFLESVRNINFGLRFNQRLESVTDSSRCLIPARKSSQHCIWRSLQSKLESCEFTPAILRC